MSCQICPVSNSRICRPDEHCGLCVAETLESAEEILDRVFPDQQEDDHEPN
jgi:uncharacterized protein (UPF0305 family)